MYGAAIGHWLIAVNLEAIQVILTAADANGVELPEPEAVPVSSLAEAKDLLSHLAIRSSLQELADERSYPVLKDAE